MVPQVRFNLSTFFVSTGGFYFHHPAPSLWRILTPAAGACFTSPWGLPRPSDWQAQEAANTEWDLYILQNFSMRLIPLPTVGCSLKLHGGLPPFPVPLT